MPPSRRRGPCRVQANGCKGKSASFNADHTWDWRNAKQAGKLKRGDADFGDVETEWPAGTLDNEVDVCGNGPCCRLSGSAPVHKKRAAAKPEPAPAPTATATATEPSVPPTFDGAGVQAASVAAQAAANAAAAAAAAAAAPAECMAQRFAGGASVRGSGLSAVARIVGHRLCDPAKLYGQARMPAAEHNFEMELRLDGFEPELLVWGVFDDGDGADVMDVRFVPEADVYAIAADPAEVLEDVEAYFSHFSAQTAKHAEAGAELLQRAYVVCDSAAVRFQLATCKEKEAKEAAAAAGRAAKRAAASKTAAEAAAAAAAAKAEAAKASEAATFAQAEAERMTEAVAEAQAEKASAAKEACEARIRGAPTAAPAVAPTAAPATTSAAAPAAQSNAARKRPITAVSQSSPAEQPRFASPRRGRSSGQAGPAAEVEAAKLYVSPRRSGPATAAGATDCTGEGACC